MNTIAVVFGPRGGGSYHRQVTPHSHLSTRYASEFRVLFFNDINDLTEDDWNSIQLIQFFRNFPLEGTQRHIDKISSKNIKVVIDMDDTWTPEKGDPGFSNYDYIGLPEKIAHSIKAADYITCTTSILADKVAELNKNVLVVPNAINPDVAQFKPTLRLAKNRISFAWIGSPSHIKDVASMSQCFIDVDRARDLKGQWQLCLGGFNMGSGAVAYAKQKDNSLKPVDIPPYKRDYGIMERIMTDEYRLLRGMPEYLKYLARFKEEELSVMDDKPYKRLWWKDVTAYGSLYNEADVVFIPLVNSKFNRHKSQLKLIEAAFFGKAVICNDVIPYSADLNHAHNCLKVHPERSQKDFYIAMRKLIKDPSEITRLGNNLRIDLVPKYNMDKVNVLRYELYKELIRKANAN